MTVNGVLSTEDGGRIAWRMEGPPDAPVLMLSNSLGTDIDMWRQQLDLFATQYRVLRYDTRGHGESGSSPGDYSLDRLGRDALALLDALEIERVHWCGVSLGGMTGQWLACRAPDRLARLVLSTTSAYMGPSVQWQTRIDTVRRDGMVAIANAVLSRWLTPEFIASRPDLAQPLLSSLRATDPQGYTGCCAAIRDMDLRPFAGLIDAPTLVIGGSEDLATPPAHARWLADHIKGATLLMLPAAHLANVEAPGTFNTAVLHFLGDGK